MRGSKKTVLSFCSIFTFLLYQLGPSPSFPLSHSAGKQKGILVYYIITDQGIIATPKCGYWMECNILVVNYLKPARARLFVAGNYYKLESHKILVPDLTIFEPCSSVSLPFILSQIQIHQELTYITLIAYLHCYNIIITICSFNHIPQSTLYRST